jgi:hypothetical protein
MADRAIYSHWVTLSQPEYGQGHFLSFSNSASFAPLFNKAAFSYLQPNAL